MKAMKLIVNGEAEKDIPETTMRITREVTPEDMDKLSEFTEWLTQFALNNIVALICTEFDMLSEIIEEFDSKEMSDVVAQAIKERYAIDRR